MKRLLSLIFLWSFMASYANITTSSIENKNPVRYYPAVEKEGYIGISEDKPVDSPTDNSFTINLSELPKSDEEVYLTYELYGISDHTGISHSINNELAVGGHFVKLNQEWNLQEEQIHRNWLHKGNNHIRFTLPENVDYHYEVRNVGIKIKKKGTLGRTLVINQPQNQAYANNVGYIKGFIDGKYSATARLYIDGVEIPTRNSAFETIIKKNNSEKVWSAELKTVFADGETIVQQVQFNNVQKADIVNKIASPRGAFNIATYQPNTSFDLSVHGAKIEIAKGSLKSSKNISITALRTVDIPALDMGMVNVTKNHRGYRFLPHGTQFSKEAKIALEYDESKIPEGYTIKDIKTYYYDEVRKHWVALKRDEKQIKEGEIVSTTTHFTDMINGIIKVPDSPETAGFTPTSIKDIKAANPSAAVNTIEPPSANNMGSAAIGYPIALPAGRQGMQPSLGIQYNSSGGNGWLGIGWDLQIPSISIDTRWGVPRYSTTEETETYSMGGQMLTPVAHRGELQPRTAEKQFYPRVEGSFNRIIRHGDNPTNYWWEVTDKSGTRYSYGGSQNLGIVDNSILKDADGNIAHWALVEVRDLNNNFVRYHCAKVEDVGVQGGSVPGYNIYIDRITYTGHGSTEGKYEVKFTRDRDLPNYEKRLDISINARYGFKQVTADLLGKIEVKFNGQNIRHYELEYDNGAFYKKLLQKITEFDAAGNEFNHHEFEYFDEIRTGETIYNPYKPIENWTPHDDNVRGDFVVNVDEFNDKASAISGSKSAGGGFGLAVTFGTNDLKLYSKSSTVGANFGHSQTKGEGMLSLIDIDGDNLPDKVYVKGDTMYFRMNQSGPDGETVFGEEQTIIGASNFSKSKTRVNTYGIESHFGVYLGAQYTDTKSTTKTYFSDVNGDRLIDLVHNGQVYFNHIVNGVPTFTLSSGDTPSPIAASSAGIDPNLITIDPQELENDIDQFPLQDMVRVWEAPFDGKVAVEAPITLSTASVDGVRVAIQHKGTELWTQEIGAGTTAAIIPGLDSITVDKGDRIYFRSQSIFNGEGDVVTWNPIITYAQHVDGLVDANGLPLYQYQASDGFIVSAAQTTGVPIAGEVIIEGQIVKPLTSDAITVSVEKVNTNGTTTPVWEENYAATQIVNENLNLPLTVAANDTYVFKVTATSNIDWKALQWAPRLYYTSSNDPNVTTVNDPNGNPMIEFYPTVHYDMFTKVVATTGVWEATSDGSVTLTPEITITDTSLNGEAVVTIKKEQELVAKQTVTINAGIVTGLSPVNYTAVAGDTLYFDVFTSDADLAETLTGNMQLTGIVTETIAMGMMTKNDSFIFGPMYHNWGQFGYNGNRDRATQPINESELNIDSLTSGGSVDLGGASTADEMQNAYTAGGGQNLNEQKFIMLMPDTKENKWKGYDDMHWLKATTQSASRLGEDNIEVVNPATSGGAGARGIDKITKGYSVGISVSAGIGGSTALGETKAVTEFQDLNGDSYPDIITKNKVQYTKADGTLEASAKEVGTSYYNLSSNNAFGASYGGSPVTSKTQISTSTVPNGYVLNEETNDFEMSYVTQVDKIIESTFSMSVNGGISFNEETSKHSFTDINGDGLPDKVYNDGQVALNLGYKFADKEPWGYARIRDGKGEDFSAGLGFSIDDNSIAGGVGLSLSLAHGQNAVQDVNGDGLPDYFEKETNTIYLNTGNGFTQVSWSGINDIQENIAVGESANVAFTVCIPLPPPPLAPVSKLCFNPSANISHGASREKVSITDIDGDGYPDILTSKEDKMLEVRRSTIGRTNLLKGVKRPLGATFAVDYKRIGNTYEQPTDVWALAKVELTDGFEGDGADTMITEFEYEDGFYDRHERDFYGFKKVKSKQLNTEQGNAVYRAVVQEFKNDNYYEKGLLEREILQDESDNLYTESLNTFELKDVQTGTTLPDAFKQNDADAAFVASTEMQKNFYEGESTAQKSTRMTYNYDVLGNVIGYTDFGDDGSDDDISSTISYHSVLDKYIVGTPREITVIGNGQTLRKRATDINTSTGNVTQIRKYLASGGTATYDMEYDGFGNLTKMTRPENAAGERLSFEYQYDPEVQTYTTNVSNGYGYSSSSEYDYRFGQMLLSTDLNGQQMRYTIDDLGRIVTITGPFELANGKDYTIKFEYHPEAEVPWAKTNHYDPANEGNDLETVTFIDGLKRSLQVKKDGAIHTSANTADTEHMIVSGRIKFDAFGRATESYYPTLEGKGSESAFNPTFDNISPTKTTYDVLDRALTVTLPDNAVTSTEYGFGSDRDGQVQFSTRVTDANGIWKQSFTNVRGLTKAVQEQYSQGSDIWTSYKYNAINELVEVIDDQNNVINSKYDWFGRRTEVVHPDAGKTTYQYDLASNLTQKVTANIADANAGGITYQYDHERLTNINYPQNPQNDVTYTYGDAGAANFRAGRIVTQEDATGTQEFFYNELGAVIKNTRTIIVPDAEPLNYTTEWLYDTWNRVTEMNYPDGEKLEYTYNVGGLLHSFKGSKSGTDYNYVKQLGYDKFEQRVYLQYGNKTETFYTYEPERRRLQNMIAETATDRKMMDNHYTYDKVNNILKLENKAEIPTSNLMGSKTEYNYSYDDLYRLTNATGSNLGSNHENKYSLAMEYNSIHSITKKDQLHQFKGYDEEEWSPRNKTTYNYDYEYGNEQPHAPIHIGEQAYTYDKNGNQTGWTHDVSGQERQILWDEENRIKAIADNGALFSYVYDAGGERVLKSNGGGQTVAVNGKKAGGTGSIGNYTIYVNPYLVIRNGKATKHFYIESQRVTTKLVEASDGLLQTENVSTATDRIDYKAKKGRMMAALLKNYADLGLEVDKVDGEAGNSGQTPPNGNAYGHGNNGGGNDGNNGGGNNGGNGDGSGGTGGNGNNNEAFVYYYHPDHLGSSSYITDINGEVTQHIEYFAFGETFVEEHSNTDRTPYLFNGKELDEETGLYYYGARYYDAKTSVWQSVDPLAEKYPNRSPYEYAGSNPVIYVDPDGRDIINADKLRLSRYTKLLQKYISANRKYDGLSRKEIKSRYGKKGLSQSKHYNKRIRQTSRSVKTYTRRSNQTDKIMAKWKKESPNLYNKIDNMTVDLHLGVDGQSKGSLGTTKTNVELVNGNYVFNSREGTNAIAVQISSGVNISSKDSETGEYSLNHEAGHFIYNVENPKEYLKFKKDIVAKGEDYKGGHHKDAPTGKSAKEYGSKKDIKK